MDEKQESWNSDAGRWEGKQDDVRKGEMKQ